MLTFKNTSIFVISLLVICGCLDIVYNISVVIYLILFFTYSLIVFYGCYFVSSGFFIKIVCEAKTDKKEIAITFDDGPAINFTGEILAILAANKVKAAFFCIGKNIRGNEAFLKEIVAQEHIIGNHSYSHHFWFDLFSTRRMMGDMRMMDEALESVTNLRPRLFRPPYGVTNPNLAKAITMGSYTPVGWSVRSMDTVIKSERKLLDKINKSLKPGAVFLFHDTSKTTLNVLPLFIKHVYLEGYKIERLDKLLDLKAYA